MAKAKSLNITERLHNDIYAYAVMHNLKIKQVTEMAFAQLFGNWERPNYKANNKTKRYVMDQTPDNTPWTDL